MGLNGNNYQHIKNMRKKWQNLPMLCIAFIHIAKTCIKKGKIYTC